MPLTTIHFFRADDGSVPMLDWLSELKLRNIKIYKKCLASLLRLKNEGHQLRRPTADLLRDGVYELRFSYLGVNYRILYGFAGKHLAVVSHGVTKERVLPAAEIDRAVERLAKYRSDPDKYGVEEEVL